MRIIYDAPQKNGEGEAEKLGELSLEAHGRALPERHGFLAERRRSSMTDESSARVANQAGFAGVCGLGGGVMLGSGGVGR